MVLFSIKIQIMKTELSNIPFLGVGAGFRSAFKADLFLEPQSLDFLEITLDHYLDAAPSKWRELEILKQSFTLIPHGLNLSLGTAEGLDQKYLDQVARLVEFVDPPYWSEHIAITKAGGIEIGHLSPSVFSTEALDVFVRNIETVKKQIPYPLVLENITYLFELPNSNLSETEFLTQILEQTDCGLLLDITNLYTNAYNHHFDYRQFLSQIPLERIIQLHFAGGFEAENGVLIDSHSQNTPQEIWELMQYVLSVSKPKGIILERDENIPPFAEIKQEIKKAKTLFSLELMQNKV